MWCAILSQDVDDSIVGQKSARPGHLARLQELTPVSMSRWS